MLKEKTDQAFVKMIEQHAEVMIERQSKGRAELEQERIERRFLNEKAGRHKFDSEEHRSWCEVIPNLGPRSEFFQA